MYDTNQFKLLEANLASKIVPNRIHDHKSSNPPRNFSKTKKLLGKSLDFGKAELTQLLQYAMIFF